MQSARKMEFLLYNFFDGKVDEKWAKDLLKEIYYGAVYFGKHQYYSTVWLHLRTIYYSLWMWEGFVQG